MVKCTLLSRAIPKKRVTKQSQRSRLQNRLPARTFNDFRKGILDDTASSVFRTQPCRNTPTRSALMSVGCRQVWRPTCSIRTTMIQGRVPPLLRALRSCFCTRNTQAARPPVCRSTYVRTRDTQARVAAEEEEEDGRASAQHVVREAARERGERERVARGGAGRLFLLQSYNSLPCKHQAEKKKKIEKLIQ